MIYPRVNILIPCYNQARFLTQAIDSALSQSYENLKIIICDDKSNDETESVLLKYKNNKRVEYRINDVNLGRLQNYRKLLYELCDGDYAVNLDGDDYYTDSFFIENAMKIILSMNNIVFVNSNQHYGKIDKFNLLVSNQYKVMEGADYVFNYYANDNFTHLGSLYDVKLARKVGFYTHNIISSDADSFLRLAFQGKVAVSNYKVGFWRKHQENESTTSDIERKYENFKVLTENLSSHVNNDFISLSSKLPAWRSKMAVQYIYPMLARSIKNKKEFSFIFRKIKKYHLRQFCSFYFPLYVFRRTYKIILRTI